MQVHGMLNASALAIKQLWDCALKHEHIWISDVGTINVRWMHVLAHNPTTEYISLLFKTWCQKEGFLLQINGSLFLSMEEINQQQKKWVTVY